MAFTQTTRIWWTSTDPGSSTSNLEDATPSAGTPAAETEQTGVQGRRRREQWVVCARSAIEIPLSQAVIDPNTNRLVWDRFVDPPSPVPDVSFDFPRPGPLQTPLVRPGEFDDE